MRKKSMLAQLSFLLLFLLIIVGFTPARNILNTNAQNVVSPTYGCLSPGCAGSAMPSSPPGTGLPVASPLPSSPVITASSSAAAQPCTASSLPNLSGENQTNANSTSGRSGDDHRGRRGGHHNGGFLKEFFKLFLLLLELILKAGGGSGLPCSPTTATPTISPTASSAPSVAPVVSTPTTNTTTPATASGTTASSGASVVNTGAGSLFAGPFGNNCIAGQNYCNGHVVTGGQVNGLYTCQPHDAPKLKQQCPAACKVNASGSDSC